jgi:hypothetical protein
VGLSWTLAFDAHFLGDVEFRPRPELVHFCDIHGLTAAVVSDAVRVEISGDSSRGHDIRGLQCAIQCLTPGQHGLFQSRNDS